jgi:hypothetical protein
LTAIPLNSLELFGFCDPAAGKSARLKKKLARQSIIIGARDWLDRWFIVHAWAGRKTPSELMAEILSVYSIWKPRRFGIEANGMQVLFGELVRDEARRQFGEIRLVPVYQPTNVEKHFRIRSGLEPVINNGRLFLPNKTSPLAVEIRGFPTAATKDLVDSLESMIRLAPKRPKDAERDVEIDQYASYLRSTGCPSQMIAQKIAEYQLTNSQ